MVASQSQVSDVGDVFLIPAFKPCNHRQYNLRESVAGILFPEPKSSATKPFENPRRKKT
jgi:hypothetical protein